MLYAFSSIMLHNQPAGAGPAAVRIPKGHGGRYFGLQRGANRTGLVKGEQRSGPVEAIKKMRRETDAEHQS